MPAFVFVGLPYGAEFEGMRKLMEESGCPSEDLIVMCEIGGGIAFVFDMKAGEWVEEGAFHLKNRCVEGVSACVGAFIVARDTFTLGTIDRPYVLFPLDSASIVGNWWGRGREVHLIAVEMRAWEATKFETYFLFQDCFNLRFVSLPVRMRKVEKYAFLGCQSLECASLIDCSSLCVIEDFAFSGCTRLRKVILSGSIEHVKRRAFENSGVRLLDASRCPGAEFGRMTLSGSLLDKVITSFESCEAVCRIGAEILEGTQCSTFISAMKSKREELEESGVRNALLSVSGASSITLISPGCTITLSDVVDLQALPVICTGDGGPITLPSRVIASGPLLPSFSLPQNVLSLSLRGLRPEVLWYVGLSGNVRNLRELFFPEGMTVVPGCLCENLRRLKRVVFPGPSILTNVGRKAFAGCCSLGSFPLPATVKMIEKCAFSGTGIEGMDLLGLRVQSADCDEMTRVEFLAFGPSVDYFSFRSAASLRSITFGRMRAKNSECGCGGHPVEARCLTLEDRFPQSLECVLREAHLFGELGSAGKRVACPMTPP
jgi:hypothetical protein